MTITGGCLCRAVRYEISADPVTTRTCWCRDCQYFAGGSATVSVVFPADAVSVTGPLSDYASMADSGSHMHRHFCTVCGTPMFSAADERPHLTIVRAGTLDDPAIGAPQITIWADSAPGWAVLDPALPRTSQQP